MGISLNVQCFFYIYILYIYIVEFAGLARLVLNPIALRKAKIVYNFGLSECKRVEVVECCSRFIDVDWSVNHETVFTVKK